MAGETTVSWEPSVAEKVKALTVGMIEGTRPLLVALVRPSLCSTVCPKPVNGSASFAAFSNDGKETERGAGAA